MKGFFIGDNVIFKLFFFAHCNVSLMVRIKLLNQSVWLENAHASAEKQANVKIALCFC